MKIPYPANLVSYLIATENCYLFVAFIGLTGCPEDNIHIFLKQGINGTLHFL